MMRPSLNCPNCTYHVRDSLNKCVHPNAIKLDNYFTLAPVEGATFVILTNDPPIDTCLDADLKS